MRFLWRRKHSNQNKEHFNGEKKHGSPILMKNVLNVLLQNPHTLNTSCKVATEYKLGLESLCVPRGCADNPIHNSCPKLTLILWKHLSRDVAVVLQAVCTGIQQSLNKTSVETPRKCNCASFDTAFTPGAAIKVPKNLGLLLQKGVQHFPPWKYWNQAGTLVE